MKFPKPWFRPSRGLWFVTIHGKQINLGTDKEAAFAQYKALLTKPADQTPPPSDGVLAIVEKYLDWCQDHRSAGTYAWYQWRLQYFALLEMSFGSSSMTITVNLPPATIEQLEAEAAATGNLVKMNAVQSQCAVLPTFLGAV